MTRSRRSFHALALAVLALLGAPVAAVHAQFGIDSLEPADGDKLVTMDVISAEDSVTPGATEYIGVRLRIQKDWHIYWSNPGDSGASPKIRVDAPLGVEVGPIAWPRPVIFESPDETTYGYADEAVLLVPVKIPADFSPGTLKLPIEAEWLVCKRACLFGEGEGAITLNIAHPTDNRLRPRTNRLQDAIRRLPTPIEKAEGVTARIEEIATPETAEGRRLVITGPAAKATRIRFIPDLTPGVRAGDGHPVDATISEGRFRIAVPMTVEPGNAAGKPLEVAGLVLFGPRPTDRAISFRMPVTD